MRTGSLDIVTWLLLILLAVCLAPCAVSGEDFKLYQWIEKIEGKPDLRLPTVTMLNANQFFDRSDGGLPQTVSRRKLLHRARRLARERSPVAIVDIEHLPHADNDDEKAIKALKEIALVTKTLRAASPDSQIGVYGVMPIRSYWAPVNYRRSLDAVEQKEVNWASKQFNNHKKKYDRWKEKNARAKTAGLADSVDIICPSLYTFYRDAEKYPDVRQDPNVKYWRYYAEENIKQARTYHKPVIVFLWPQYHQGGNYAGHWVEKDFFRYQLETAFELADGAVVWNYKTPRGVPEKWSYDWGWAKALWAFKRSYWQREKRAAAP